jgi:hypothetical protein
MQSEFADHIVIGSGPGGAVAAHALHEHKKDFLLLESGSAVLGNETAALTDQLQKSYRGAGLTFAWGKPKIHYAEGKNIGGGSEINSGLYHRTPPEIIAAWQKEYLIEQFSQELLAEHFEFNEKLLEISNHGNEFNTAGLKLSEGAKKLSLDCRQAPVWLDSSGRRSMSKTFLRNLQPQILSETTLTRFHRSHDYWVLETIKNGSVRNFKAKNLFFAGGAVSTPQLLKRNLSSVNTGQTLQFHPTVKVTARFKNEINDGKNFVPNQQVKIGPGMSLGCSISSRAVLASSFLDHQEHFHLVNNSWKNMAIYYGAIIPEGRGSIRSYPLSSEPFVHYKLTKSDFEKLISVMSKLIEVLFSAEAEEIYPHIAGFGAVRNLREFQQRVGQLKHSDLRLMSVHLFSGCQMGEASHCPVDSYGKVKSAPGIYVSDASMLPGATGVNPQGTIMAISRRNILHFLNSSSGLK